MTRETKIGLLVGLAFIIVIGILLSDHLTSSTEPPQAPLATAGSTVRSTVTSPGQPGPQPAPVTQNNPTPNQQVPTQDELTPGPNPVQIVKVGPGDVDEFVEHNESECGGIDQSWCQSSSRSTRVACDAAEQCAPQAEPLIVNNDAPTITRMPPVEPNAAPNRAPNSLDTLARSIGEELVSLDANGRAVSRANGRHDGWRRAPLKRRHGRIQSRARRYALADRLQDHGIEQSRERDGDRRGQSVAEGQSGPDHRRSKVPDPDECGGRAATHREQSSRRPANQHRHRKLRRTRCASRRASSGTPSSPAKACWRIAAEQCGKPSAVAAIKELNKDVLKGQDSDQVQAGMKIRLPGKPIAANQ